MTSTIQNEGTNQVKLTITVDAETFEKAIQKAYIKDRGRMNVPGFRKGKAPRKVIEQMYGSEVFYGDAMEDVWGEAYDNAVEEHGIEPVDNPSIDVQDVSKDGFTFTATVFVKPEVTLGEYKGIAATRVAYTVPEAMIDAEIDKAREGLSRMVEVECEAKTGDTVIMDYAGTIDGVAFAGGTAEEQSLELGSGHFIPGFEEQVEGHKAGEEFDVSVKFPEDYHSDDVKGKDAVFHVTLRTVQEKQLPDIDDEFVKDVTDDCETLAEYRESIKKRLDESAKTDSDNMFDNELFGKIVENASVEIPAPMIERQIDSLLRDFERQLSYQGISLDIFAQYTGSTMEQMRDRYRPEAERRVKSQLVIEAIRTAEGIVATDTEVEEEIVKIAEETKQTVEDIKTKIGDEQRGYIADEIAVRKTFELLRAEAVESSEERVYGEAKEEEAEIVEDTEAAADDASVAVDAEVVEGEDKE